MNFRHAFKSSGNGPTLSRLLGYRDVAVLILCFGSASLLWGYLWIGEIKCEMGCYNTAPIFLNVVWSEGTTMEERGSLSFEGRSTTSGKAVPPERLDVGNSTIFRWRWVLLDQISILHETAHTELIHRLEFAVDPSVRQRGIYSPDGLVVA